MAEPRFDTPVFIVEKQSTPVDLSATPFFYNAAGQPSYVASLPAGVTPLSPVATDPALAVGHEYLVREVVGVKPNAPYGIETQLGMQGERITYEPLWVSRSIAAAFGITLIAPGEAIQIASPVPTLAHIEYEYGVFAGHWSPYQGTGNQLLTEACTDLEHHDFPHVFASTDADFPLVISVARYWPALGKIRLADLWVPTGYALYIPPKPADPALPCIDLHNNRNSARACWGQLHRHSIHTDTLLQAEHGYFYWYWNAIPTHHSHPAQPG
ncbi:hypothetical protein [Chitinibacter sp. ZOR0017]|uniref:hypothetical protein n=1 Tax=Chitinibacter sp. ZOR0017 TaxID=1339254 RepID=UPI0006473874|nr:hypothetical protein [Chitinibacter sp. ZOR0017]